MPIEVLQRLTWNGTPKELGDLFRLTKNRREARAALYSHQFGWEVRLLVGRQQEPVRTQVCKSQDDVLTTGETWKASMMREGWNA
jgi:hypothetical protein